MNVPGAHSPLALTRLALGLSRRLRCLATLALAACSEPSAPACATQIAAEVCATPAQPRGAQLVQPSASSNVSVQLPSAVLPEGRYVLVARSYSCPDGSEEQAPAAVQGVLELSGCVLRRTFIAAAPEPALVEVFELGYAGEGRLALQRRCLAEPAGALQAAYGFDGERLELGRLQAAPDTSGSSAAAADGTVCDTLDTWELR